MWLSRFRNRIVGPRCHRQPAPKPRRRRLLLEQLEDRTLPSNYTAASVSALIADINAANAAGGSNTIVLAANTTFDLTAVNNTNNSANGLPVIANKDNLTITGQGGDIIQRDTAAPAFRLFDVPSHAGLTLTNLTLQNGLAFGSGSSAEGGAIYNQGSLTVNGTTVQNNTAQGSDGIGSGLGGTNKGQDAAGGAIWSHGTLTLGSGAVVESNQALGGSGYNMGNGGNAFGGGVYFAGGTASLTGATINNNSARGGAAASSGSVAGNASGGAFYVGAGSVTLNSDVVEYNSATGGAGNKYSSLSGGEPGGNASGGAAYIAGGAVTLNGDVLEYNSATGGVGGEGAVTITGGIFSPGGTGGSAFGGGLYMGGGSVTLTNDLLENNSATGGAGGYPGGGAAGTGFGGALYVDGGATVTLCSDTVEFNAASTCGGGMYIAPKTTVYIDSFTVANTFNNTDSSGTNGTTANIDGSYILKNC